MSNQSQFVILGAGLTGLSAAYKLQSKAVILEKSERPGGLVKSANYSGYWFDHVLHMLHFKDMTQLESEIKTLMDGILKPVYPEAWVETKEGTGRYPLQMNLYGLSPIAIANTLSDLAKVTFSSSQAQPKNFEEMLQKSFGNYFSDLFMLPYNRKVWKRPLRELAPTGFQWNIDHPDYDMVLQGALNENSDFVAYNSNGWYPIPQSNAPLRGMEILSKKLADKINNLHLNSEVVGLEIKNQIVSVKQEGKLLEFQYSDKCLSTIPLPKLLSITKGLPNQLHDAISKLKYNRVITVMISIQGPRPEGRGQWRYYAQEELCFTRLIYMHNFDPYTSPEDGWSLMAEITEPSEWPLKPEAEIIEKTIEDIKKANALPSDCNIIDTNMLVISPAYVVFTEESKSLVEDIKQFYKTNNVKLLGRYGQWEYSSMAQVMRDGFQWAESVVTQ